ncbi:unnamed protein product [Staurois parvus]|uniref:Uncharacterized protein n=1 Tax=Staurois parvus TaxID=386267 RepID=A0ABN9BW20_9NEOB|nr:unnamed protein product [Staurois parvus]
MLNGQYGHMLPIYYHDCLFAVHLQSDSSTQGQTDHLATQVLPQGPGSVGGPMRCPWYLSWAFLGVV